MGTDDTTPQDHMRTDSEQERAHSTSQDQSRNTRALPPRFCTDFMKTHAGPNGRETVMIKPVDAPEVARLDLHEGMSAVFEEPGEFQMTGTLHRRRWDYNGRVYWEGDLDPHSLVYHIRVAPETLYRAGPEGCTRMRSWMPGRLPEPGSTGEREAPKPSGPPTDPSWTMEQPTPWRMLTLGVEGTWEQWHHSLAHDTVDGDWAFTDGEPAVLVDDAREVDALVHVWRLPPEDEYPDGRRVWMAEPDWATVRIIWPDDEETPDQAGAATDGVLQPPEDQ